MNSAKNTANPTPGIEVRHSKRCAAPKGRCTCSPSYRAEAYDARVGRKVRRTCRSLAEAKRWRHDAITAVHAGDLSADRGPTLNEAVASWFIGMEAGAVTNRSGQPFKPSAIRGYRHTMNRRVLPVLGHHRVDELAMRDVQGWVDGLVAQGLAPATIDAALTSLRAFYRRAHARGDVRSNPTLRVEKPGVVRSRKRVVDPEVAVELLDALTGADRVLWAVAMYAGLRRGELAALKWENVDLASGVLRVEHGWDVVEGEIAPKSRQGRRTVPIAATLRDYLDEHRLTTGGEGHIFQSHRWVQGSNDRARTAWTSVGLPVVTLHEARHTCASLMIAAGVNVKALSTFMGHANIGVTLDLYAHLLPGAEDVAASLLDAYLARSAGAPRDSRGTVDTPSPAVPSGPPAVEMAF